MKQKSFKQFRFFFLNSVQGARCGNRRKFHADRENIQALKKRIDGTFFWRVCWNVDKTYIETPCHKIGWPKQEKVDEQLVQLFSGPNDCFWGGWTVGPFLGTNVTRTKRFWDSMTSGPNVWVQLLLGPNVGGRNVKAPLLLRAQY